MSNNFYSIPSNTCTHNSDQPIQEQEEKPLMQRERDCFRSVIPDMQISLSVDAEDTLCPSFMGSDISLLGESMLGSGMCDVFEWDASPLNKPYQLSDSFICHKSYRTNPISRKHYLFTKEEDENLKELIKVYGVNNWEKIASRMEGKTPNQLRNRYNNFLKRKLNPYLFSEDEDVVVLGEERNNKQVPESVKDKTSRVGRKRRYSRLKPEEPLKLIPDAVNRGSCMKTINSPSKLRRCLGEEGQDTLKNAIEMLREQNKRLNIGLGKVGIMLDKLKTECN